MARTSVAFEKKTTVLGTAELWFGDHAAGDHGRVISVILQMEREKTASDLTICDVAR